MSSPFPAPPSFVTTAEMATYSTQFLALPSAQADFRKRASGQEVRTVLIKSGLPAPVLGQIWSLADMSKCGALTFAEFLLALSLAKHAMANVSVVPAELPVRIQNEVFSLNIQLGFSSSTPSVASVTGPLSAQQTGFTSVSQRPINPASYEVSMAPAMPAIPPGMAAAMMGGGSGLPQSTSLGSLQHLASTSRVNSAGSLGLSAMSVPGIISSLPVGGAVGTTWTITHDERVKYASLFKSWDSASVGYLSGEQCRDIFSTSGLPQNIMQHIWSLADIHNAGKLNSDEFAIAMHLIYKKLNNVDLPTKLPEELIPASHKDLDMSVSFMKDKLMQQMLSEKMAAASAPSWARGGAVSSGAGISATAPGSGEVAGTGYVSKHRRRGAGGDPSSTQTPPTDPVAKERAVDLQRQIDQARELLTLKREQAQRLRIAQGKLEDPARVRELHGQIAELQKVLRALKAQFDDRLRSGVAISSTDSASAGALRPIVDQILESKRKFNEVQLKLFKLRDLKKYKYPPIPEKTAINLSSLLGSSSGSTSTIVSEDERRRQKAAEMLAQRMAALNMGPSSTAPTPAALTPAQTEAMARIDAEKARLDAALRELEGKLKSVVDPAAAQALLAEFQVQVKLLDDLLRPVQLPSEYAESATTPAAPEPVRDREAFDALRERLRKVTEASTLPPPPPPQQREQQNSQLISDSQRYTAGNPFGAAAAAVAMSQPSAPSPFASPFEQQAARPSAASPPAPAKDDVTHKSISDRAAALSSIFPGVIAPPHDQKSTVSPPDAAQRRMSTDWLSSGSAVATATDTFAADPFAPPPPPVPSGLGQFAAPTALPPIKVAQAAAATPPKPRSPSPVKAAATPSSPRVFDNPFAVPASQAAPSPSPSSSPFNPFGEPTSPFAEPTPAPADPFAAAAAAAPSPFASAAPSPSVLYMATAQYAYEATNAEEMDLAEFDRIEVLEVDDEWGRGRKAGSTIEGWFPMSYIKQGAQKESAAADTAASARGMMLYDYTATASDELTVNADVHVDILDDATDPDWWLVGVNGERGLVPANYVERIARSKEIGLAAAPRVSFDPFADGPESDVFHLPLTGNGAGQAATAAPMNAHLLGAVSQDDWLAVPSLRHKKSATSIASEGSTWSAVMYPQLIQSLSPEERKRQEAIFEFIKTEQSYVRDLQVVMDVFIQPLTLGPHAATILGPNHVATGKQMFANWEEILITNVAFLSDLELRQEQDDGLVGAPGEVILEHIGSMRCYMQFCTGQKQALTTLTQLLRDRLEFKDFIKQRQGDPRCRSLDLSSYLLKPVQRLTRYPLLIKQVLHYTPEVHSDHPALVQCLSTAEKVLHEVNEGARTEEDNIKFAEIAARVDLVVGQSPLDLKSPTKFMGKRHFIHEGELSKAKSGRALRGFLFNDLLLLCEAKRSDRGLPFSIYRAPIPLDLITNIARDAMNKEEFTLTINDSTSLTTDGNMVLRCPDQSSRNMFANAIDAAVAVIRSKAQAVERHQASAEVIGTLRVFIAEGKGLVPPDPSTTAVNLFVELSLAGDTQRTKIVRKASAFPAWNQALTLSVTSFDESLRFVLFNQFDKYSQADYFGSMTLPLHVLEYYGDKEMTQDLPLENIGGKAALVVKLQFRGRSK